METKLLFSLSLETPVPVTLSASAGFCYITVTENKTKIKMPLYEGTLLYFYPDYKNYYYLPFEDEAIHKSLSTRAPSCIFIQTIKIITTCHLKMKQYTKALPLTWNLPTGKKPQLQLVTKKSAVNSSMHLVHRIYHF